MRKLILATALSALASAAWAAAPASITITGQQNDWANSCADEGAESPRAAVTIINTIPGVAWQNFTVTDGSTTWVWEAGFQILEEWAPLGYGVVAPIAWPDNSVLTATIYTYATSEMSTPIYSSSISWNCTTGEQVGDIVNRDLTPTSVAVPTHDLAGLLALGTLVAGAAMSRVRRRPGQAEAKTSERRG